MRDNLLESVAENDEEMMKLYLEGEEPNRGAARRRDPAGDRRQLESPRCCAARPFKNKGVQPMLDALVAYLPSPLDIPSIKGHAVGKEDVVVERHADPGEPLSALAFKIMSDPHLGKLTYLRVYSGTLETGTQVLNSVKGRKERIGKIYQMHANKREERPTAAAGPHRGRHGLEGHHDRRHAVRRRTSRWSLSP